MESYYAIKAGIRYYGRIPGSVEPPRAEQSPLDYDPVRFTLGSRKADNWKEPVHVAVANLRTVEIATGNPTLAPVPARADSAALFRFVKMYGPLTHPALLHERAGSESYVEDPVTFGQMQFVLRRAWSGDAAALKLIRGDAGDRDYLMWATLLHGNDNKWEGVAAKASALPTPSDAYRPVFPQAIVGASGFELVVRDLWSLTRLLFIERHREGRIRVCKNPDCATPYFVQDRKGQVFCSHACAVLINVRRFRKREKAATRKSR